MKKASLLFIVTAVIIFNSVGFFAIGQDSLPKEENLSVVVHASNEVGNSSFDAVGASVAGIDADDPISMTHFTILVSSLILMLLIVNKASRY